MDESTIREQFDNLLKRSDIKLDDAEYETKYHIFKAGWIAHDKWYKDRYCDDGK